MIFEFIMIVVMVLASVFSGLKMAVAIDEGELFEEPLVYGVAMVATMYLAWLVFSRGII